MCSSQRFYRDRRDFSWWPVRERLPGKVDKTVGLFDQGKCGPFGRSPVVRLQRSYQLILEPAGLPVHTPFNRLWLRRGEWPASDVLWWLIPKFEPVCPPLYVLHARHFTLRQ